MFFLSFFLQFCLVYGQLDIVTDETPLVERGACISNPCLHNGMCIVTKSGFICTCVNGFIGVNCERRADDCPRDLSMNCIHGVCKLDMDGHPQCICVDGYEGPTCQLQIDNCVDGPCLNSGTCIDKVGGYECKCPAGTSGSHCQIKDANTGECLSSCGDHFFEGKCWKDSVSKVIVGWGLGENFCNSRQTCFNATKGMFDVHEFVPLQLKPIQMQVNDDLIFITDSDAILYDYHFVPHILPMEASSEVAFLSCNISNALPVAENSSITKVEVNETLLHPGTQYFIADTNKLYKCDFGLRLNVTVKEKKCVDPSTSTKQICNGHGKCFTDFTRKNYECLCCNGYAGQYCQHEDPCIAKPCLNEGQCNILDFGKDASINHECICPSGYHGKQCEKLINLCHSYPCKNDGACYPELGDYRCKCKVGYTGKQCEVNEDECASSPCKNDAKCQDGLNNFKCACQPGFRGTLCEINIDDCESQPCINSTCLDTVNNYTCTCSPGQSGRNCETVLDDCSSQPCIHGKCVKEKNDGFSCSCGVGYTGQLCELKLNLCQHSQYCITSHAVSCEDTGDNVTCTCKDGWAGSNCGVNFDECANHNCSKGGKCIDGVNGYSCNCGKGFTGLYCEVAPARAFTDIQIDFMADDCQKFRNPRGVRHLEENLLALLRSACRCSLTLADLEVDSSKILCKDDMAGTFQANLVVDLPKYDEIKKQVICSMKKTIQTEKTPTIYHNTYIVNIKDEEELCERENLQVTELSSSKTGVVVVVVSITLIMCCVALLFVVYKLKRSRNFRVGVTHKFIKETSFNNAAYYNHDISKDDSFDETSFVSRDHSLDQSREPAEENVMECPRWANSYDLARKLCERNRSNVPSGRPFDFQNPGGNSSEL